jgi:hypothetical protein
VPTPKTTATLDFLLRLAFFSTAPLLLVRIAALFPMTGALAQIALTLIVFFAAEAVRRVGERSRLARLVLSSQLEFEAYYLEHPPRPFLYYVLYPLLFPYWLAVRRVVSPRRGRDVRSGRPSGAACPGGRLCV